MMILSEMFAGQSPHWACLLVTKTVVQTTSARLPAQLLGQSHGAAMVVRIPAHVARKVYLTKILYIHVQCATIIRIVYAQKIG